MRAQGFYPPEQLASVLGEGKFTNRDIHNKFDEMDTIHIHANYNEEYRHIQI